MRIFGLWACCCSGGIDPVDPDAFLDEDGEAFLDEDGNEFEDE